MNTIFLNKHIYSADYFRELTPDVIEDQPIYLKDIFSFLHQWFDDSQVIDVKTSGSTGMPKIISLSKETMRQSARATLDFFRLKKNDPVLLCLSANYIAGKMMLVRAIEGELDLTAIEPATVLFIPPKLFRFCAMVPMQVEETLRVYGNGSFSCIESLIIGGAPVSSSLEHKLKAVSAACYVTYGMTETASHVALKRLNTNEPYRALPGISFHEDDRHCLIVKAPLLHQDLLSTNDIVELCNSSEFHWKGRYDFVVNSGGIKIVPEELEKKIEPFLKQPFYFSKRSSQLYGEELILVLEGDKLSSEAENELLMLLATILTKYEKPKAVYYIQAFEYTSNGKLKRQIFF